MGDKNELYNIREEHIIRFHVSQGKEKKKRTFLEECSNRGKNVLKQRKKQVQKPKCGSVSGHAPGITRKPVWLE